MAGGAGTHPQKQIIPVWSAIKHSSLQAAAQPAAQRPMHSEYSFIQPQLREDGRWEGRKGLGCQGGQKLQLCWAPTQRSRPEKRVVCEAPFCGLCHTQAVTKAVDFPSPPCPSVSPPCPWHGPGLGRDLSLQAQWTYFSWILASSLSLPIPVATMRTLDRTGTVRWHQRSSPNGVSGVRCPRLPRQHPP